MVALIALRILLVLLTKPLAIYSSREVASEEHYEQLRDKSPEKRMAFYRDKARRSQAEIAPPHQERPANERY